MSHAEPPPGEDALPESACVIVRGEGNPLFTWRDIPLFTGGPHTHEHERLGHLRHGGGGRRRGPSSLRVFSLFAFTSRAQGSSGAVATVPFVWRSHAKSPTTRAGRALDIALWVE